MNNKRNTNKKNEVVQITKNDIVVIVDSIMEDRGYISPLLTKQSTVVDKVLPQLISFATDVAMTLAVAATVKVISNRIPMLSDGIDKPSCPFKKDVIDIIPESII